MRIKRVFVLVGAIFASALFFSHSAYADATISISNSGKVSFGKVQPSSAGALATATDTISVDTNCTAGVNVYASGTNGGSTSMVNSAAGSNNTIATSSAAIGSATALSNNTWGLNTNSTQAGNGLYYGLPAYSASSLPSAIYSGTSSSIPVYYGAKVTSSLTPGTYTGEVLYTVTVHSSCLNYIVSFNKNANDATGSMSDQSIPPGVATALSTNSFSRSGYVFLGWSTSSSATTPTYTDGQSVTDIAPGGGTVVLYAVWGKTMQSFAANSDCTSMATNSYVTLYDARDENPYAVKRLADGNCWMVQNLRLAGGRVLTSSDSDVSSNFDLTSLDQSGSSGWCTTAGTSCYEKKSIYYDSSTRYSYGAIYNWYTATAGTGDSSLTSGEAPSSVCPKGWKLPTGDANGNFANLDKAWGGTGANRSSANTYNTFTGTYTTSSNGNFTLAGYIDGSLGYVSTYGSWWSSTPSSSDNAYSLNLYSVTSNVHPQGNYYRYVGRLVRCISGIIYQMSFADSVNYAKTNTPATQTVVDSAATHIFTTPSTAPTPYKPWTFKDYSYNSNTYGTNSTVTVYNSSPSATLVMNWQKNCNPASTPGCQLEDGKTYVWQKNFTNGSWNKLCASSDNCRSSTYCPSGYYVPTAAMLVNLMNTEGRDNKLYDVFEPGGWISFWASTEVDSSKAYNLSLNTTNAYQGTNQKYNYANLLCYK